MPSVRLPTTWLSVVDVSETSVQSESKLPVLFFLYCHLLRVPSPPTDAVSVSLPLPAPDTAPGFAGLPGLVRNADAVASSVLQPLSL